MTSNELTTLMRSGADELDPVAAERILRQLPTGGRTPLADGLRLAGDLLEKEKTKDAGILPLLIVVSDGRANVALHGSDPIEDVRRMSSKIRELNVNAMVVDTEAEHFRIGLASRLAGWLGGLAPIADFNPLLQMASGVYLTFFGSFVFGTPEFPVSDVPLQRIAAQVAAGRLKAKPESVREI